ncbi:MAG: S-layer homology domain-containing protein [Oscillospiraceae bacterium]|nr:S-layer homology domain-containing protein [Oscillospiraceae bacterium]
MANKKNTRNRVLPAILTVVLLLTMLPITSFAAAASTPPAYYVALGDSVPAGFALPDYTQDGISPLPDCYVGLISASTGMNIPAYDLAVSGLTSSTLLSALQSLQTVSPASYGILAGASYITLNIGGNNLLDPLINAIEVYLGVTDLSSQSIATIAVTNPSLLLSLSSLDLSVFGAQAVTLQAALQAGVTQFTTDFPNIITEIKSIAPNAKLVVSTIYNPFPQDASPTGLYVAAESMLGTMNQVISSGSVIGGYAVADTHAAFEAAKLAGTNPINFDISTLNFDIHPNTSGHAIMADLHKVAFADFPAITTTALPDGTVGVSYNQNLAATGATPITWSLDTGSSLPDGLTLSTGGVISGTPTVKGTFDFTVKASNGLNPDATQLLSIEVSAASGGGYYNNSNDGGGYSNISNTPVFPVNTTISQSNANFDKNGDADLTVTLSGSYILNSVNNGKYTLVNGTDYLYGNNAVTIKASYLETLSVGAQIITFAMSGGTNPTLTVTVKDTAPTAPETKPWVNLFTDVKSSDWFYGDVEFAVVSGLMIGTSTDPMQFSPQMTFTRGMTVTVLYREAGSPDASKLTNPFSDVAGGQYYTDAVKWAAAIGIIADTGKYAPDAAITRQDLVVMLYNAAKYAGLKLSATRDYTDFTDSANIASSAKDAIQALYSAGIINGYPDGSFQPNGTATRAEVAAMFHRFFAIITKK